MLAVAAVRYFMVKFSRGKVIAFDLGEALNFTGESGPYIQYAVVRANKIVHNLEERLGVSEAALVQSLGGVPPAELDGANGSHEVWALVLEAPGSTTSSSR
jgi:arginyl-tRNA synthetase